MRTNKTTKWCWMALLAVALTMCSNIAGAWVSVGDGIEYQSFTTPDPNNVFVCRMLRTNTNATLESSMANGKLSGSFQTVPSQAALFDEAISWWGEEWGARNDVVCAINGGFYNTSTGVIQRHQVHSGWYAKRMPDFFGYSGFGWTVDRLPFIGGCIHTTSGQNYLTDIPFTNKAYIDDVNAARGANNVIIYTPQYDSNTLTDNTGVEWVVQMDRPALILPSPDKAEGTITQIRLNQGSTPIPWDCVVVSATGSRATAMQSYLAVGTRIGITQSFYDYEVADCSTPRPNNWTKTFASIGGNFTFLENGVIQSTTNPGLLVRDPCTAIAYNDYYVFYVVVDGRSAASVGMTMAELAQWCKTYLQATNGMNQDGGGSSTMVVNGKVMNVPSDGSPRAVANGMMMINVSPKLQSTTFSTGQTVTVNTSSTYVRLGPGTNYASIATKNKNSTGTIVSDAYNGVRAKSYFWWKVDFGSGVIGWVAETLLTPGGSGPVIVQHPTSQTSCNGNSVKFEVVATGSGAISYKWQKNTSDLSDAGHYSGTATSKLIISSIDANDYASYRCRVTDDDGSVYTNSATLTQSALPAAPTALPATNIQTDALTWNWSIVPDAQYYQLWTAASGGTQINGVINGNFYTETGLEPGQSYTRYVESWGCGASATRTQLGPTSTTARYCPENGDFESGFTSGIGNHWTKLADDGTSVFAQSTSIKHGGTSSQKIQDPSGGQAYTGWLYQKLNVQPSRKYVISYYHYHTGVVGDSEGFVTNLGCDPNGGTAISSVGLSSGPLYQWLLKTSIITSGTGGVITIGVRGGSNHSGYVGYVDDFAIAPAPPTASGGAATICGGQNTTITASGGFGGSESEFHWYTGPSGTGTHAGTGTTFIVNPTATTTYYPRWEAASSCGGCCNSGDGPSVTITVTPPPGAVTVADEGDYTPSQNTLNASWTEATDSGCGVNHYDYAVGTSSSTQDIKAWTSNGLSRSATISGLSLVDGTTYYVQARGVDNYGNPSSGSSADGILVAPGVTPIASAWVKANDTEPLSLRDKIVTAQIGDAFWLEETNRTGAIKVVSAASVARGETVSVAGVLGLSGTQRVLYGDVVVNSGGSSVIQPLGVTCAWLGGGNYNASTPGITGGYGQYNIGMLVRCWGKVTYSNTSDPNNKYFYLDDGSGLSSDGHDGVKVWCGTVNPPTSGTVIVTGIVSSESIGGNVVPVLMVRDGAEILTL